MSKSEKKTDKYKIVSLRRLSEATGYDYNTLYNSLTGRYNGLRNQNERTEICNVLVEELTPLMEFLGFDLKVIRRKESIAEEKEMKIKSERAAVR